MENTYQTYCRFKLSFIIHFFNVFFNIFLSSGENENIADVVARQQFHLNRVAKISLFVLLKGYLIKD